MKIVLDTNVLISGIFFGGPPFQILEAWHEQKIQFLLSIEMFEEYKRVAEELAETHRGIDITAILDLIVVNSKIIHAPALVTNVCKDEEDDKFIACATAGDSKIIVTGDKAFLSVGKYQDIEIISPRQFVEKYLK